MFKNLPLVLLSATVREDEEDLILKAFGVSSGCGILTIREDNTQRPLIQLGFVMYDSSGRKSHDLEDSPKHDAILDFILKCLAKSKNGKVMVFVESESSVMVAKDLLPLLVLKRNAVQIAHDGSGVFIHSKMSEAEKNAAFQRMSSDKRVRYCVCTTVWSRGVNFSNIVGVMQAYICYDGFVAVCVIIFNCIHHLIMIFCW